MNTGNSKRKVYVVLPALNEAENIVLLLGSFSQIVRELPYTFFITIVDDGSTDGTEEAITPFYETLSLTLLRHTHNKGLSEALRSGFSSVLDQANDEDVIICMDADNTHMPGQILEILCEMEAGSDVVIASRFRSGARVQGVSLFRKFLSFVSSVLCRFFIPIPGVRDYSCGFRGYKAGYLRKAVSSDTNDVFSLKGFACTSALLFSLHHAGARMSEIPMDLRYHQKRGISKMKVTRTSVESLKVILGEIRRRFFKDAH